MSTMWKRTGTVLEMIKIQHSLFALPWAAVGALYAAHGLPPATKIAWILVAMVSARSAAMAFNRVADAGLDAENPRTQARAIPRGLISRGFTLGFTIAMLALFGIAAWMLNPICLKLAPLAAVVTLGYSYTKRFTPLCHFVLGLSLGIAPVGAWLAISPTWHPFPLLISGAVMFWIAGADILYACEDLDFDRRKGLKSIPASLGLRGAMVVSALCHVATIGALVATAILMRLGVIFYTGVAAIAVLLIYEHAIVRPDDLRRVNQAFFHVNAVVGGVILAVSIVEIFF